MAECQAEKRTRVNCYYDGFNLYHAIVALGNDKLKWLNIKNLSESFLRRGEILNEVNFFTTIPTWDREKAKRHANFLAAIAFTGVVVHEGRFQETEKYCWSNDRHCQFREEKHTDVAIAVKLLGDAHADAFDRAVLVTADADQVPVVKYIRNQFPEKKIRLMSPPGRFNLCRDLRSHVSDAGEIAEGILTSHTFPRILMAPDGTIVARMPDIYRS